MTFPNRSCLERCKIAVCSIFFALFIAHSASSTEEGTVLTPTNEGLYIIDVGWEEDMPCDVCQKISLSCFRLALDAQQRYQAKYVATFLLPYADLQYAHPTFDGQYILFDEMFVEKQEKDSNPWGVRLINTSNPKVIHRYHFPPDMYFTSFRYLDKQHCFFLELTSSLENERKYFFFSVSLETMEPQFVPAEEYARFSKEHSFGIREYLQPTQQSFEKNGVLFPPPDILSEMGKARSVLMNNNQFCVLDFEQGKNDEFLRFLRLDKAKSAWQAFSVKGTKTDIVTSEKWMAVRVGWSIPAHEPYNPVWTGEWIVVDLESLEQHSFSLKRNSKVLFERRNCLFVRSGDELQSIPIAANGEVNTALAVTLTDVDDGEEFIEPFFGPPPADADTYSGEMKEIVHHITLPDEEKQANPAEENKK